MTEKIEKLLLHLNKKEYRKNRVHVEIDRENFEDIKVQLRILKDALAKEEPVIYDDDIFGFNRHTDFRMYPLHGNVTPDYMRIVSRGFDAIEAEIRENIKKTEDADKKEYAEVMLGFVSAFKEAGEKYRQCAEEKGNEKLASVLSKIPEKGAESFYEALVFMKLCIFVMRLAGDSHLTLGRFDQYMYPYYLKDREAGISDDELFELIEAFFISINVDTDIYYGVQQGDNGQSMVLGGFDADGNSVFNELSKMCMDASLELCLIDPKINLRVGKNTPDEIFEYGTMLTKKGLGFPQYCNDDVVVPGLIKLGYSPEDAINYTVAACWEYIIPGCGADTPNMDTMDFPKIINQAIVEGIAECDTFDELKTRVCTEIEKECNALITSRLEKTFVEEPALSLFMAGCVENLCDVWQYGAKYYNFGCHGAGIANATDALAAVKKNIYDEKTIEKQELLDALNADFEGYSKIRNLLKNSPKMGNNDDYADDIAAFLMDSFSGYLNGKENGHGGIWRAGTGSAMEYLWKGKHCPATADGRRSGEPYSSSFSPSLDVKPSGLLSVIQSFTKYDMTKIINGGPLTIEIHDSVLRNDIGIKKTAMLVKNFILLGGHQLQLNSINREQLLDAQKNPEKYPNLIVRVWGWSGYFNELDREYQNHIIRRLEYVE